MVAAAVRHEHLTRSVEDYLKAIYRLAPGDAYASTSDISSTLGIAQASVSGMIRRLSETNLVFHEPYRGVRLTEAGRLAALRMVRRHRIIETYLIEKLGFDWSSVHNEAERLEHAVSDLLIERMAGALGGPRYDPHGEPIPTTEGEIEKPHWRSLNEVPVGSRVTLRQVVHDEPERLRFLESLGLQPGAVLTVTERQPFNGPTTVRVQAPGSRATGKSTAEAIGHELAQGLLCETAKEGDMT